MATEKIEKRDVNGHLDSINEMIYKLEYFNKRNAEILKYLDSLI